MTCIFSVDFQHGVGQFLPLRQCRLAWLTHCSVCGNLPPILINRRAPPPLHAPSRFSLTFCPHNKDSYNTRKDGREGRKEEESCALLTLQWSPVLQHTHISASQAASDKGQGKCTDQSRTAATTHSSAISPRCVCVDECTVGSARSLMPLNSPR